MKECYRMKACTDGMSLPACGDMVARDAQAMGFKTNKWVRNLRIIPPEGK